MGTCTSFGFALASHGLFPRTYGTMLDYHALEDIPFAPAKSVRSLMRQAAGVLAVCLTTLGGARLLMSAHSSDESAAAAGRSPFTPTNMDDVLVRPGGGVQFLPPNSVQSTSCMFFYANDLPAGLTAGAVTDEEAWLYGASATVRGAENAALPTGQASDVLKGRLVCWPTSQFNDKVKQTDLQQRYDQFKPNQGAVRRGVVSAVKRDGTNEKAYWYFKNRAQIGQQGLESGFCTPAGTPLSFYCINDVVMGGRSDSGLAPTPSGGLLFQGVISTVGGGFTSFRADLPDRVPENIQAVAITTRGGDGREYKMNFQYNGSFQFPITYEALFTPAADGSSLRTCLTLRRDFKPVYMARSLWVKDPLHPPNLLTVGLLLNHVSGINRKAFGDGDFPFALEWEKLEWLTQPCP
eukprot:g46266.t1